MKNFLGLKTKYLIAIPVVICLFILLLNFPDKSDPILPCKFLKSVKQEEVFTLEKGDLLVRPNINWWPGTSKIDSGRNFGHVSVIVQGSEGKTIDVALEKALVIEAIIFDQASRTFEFNSQKQVRKVPAIISFGKRFTGIRYRLRTKLSADQTGKMVQFLERQVADHGYSPFSSKGENLILNSSKSGNNFFVGKDWNCATLAWFALKYAVGIDIDSNGGKLVYPNDLIRSRYFDDPGNRIRF